MDWNTKSQKELFDEYNQRMDSSSDEDVVEAFNGQVGNQGSGMAKMAYLSALRAQLTKRKIDFSAVGNSESMSYAYKVILKGKKIFILSKND